MNRREQRTLQAIEKNLANEDPELAALLRSSDRAYGRWIRRFVGALALLFTLLALVAGEWMLMLTAVGATLAWVALGDPRDHRE